MKKSYKIGLFIIGILLVIFAFADMNISNTIYNSESKFGLTFEAIGEFPAAIIATFCTVSLMLTRDKNKSIKYNLGTIGYTFLLFFFSFMAAMLPVKYLHGPKFIIPVLMAMYIVISYAIAKKYAATHKNELRSAAIVGVLTFIFVIIAFNSVKLLWGRERYRHMLEVGSFAGYSMWFIPQGIASGNEFMSFPSGHSANATMMLWITLIPTFVTSLKNKKNWFVGFAGLWTILVPISRIVVGAHFASDVTMGVSITLVIFTLLKNKYINKVRDEDEQKHMPA